MIDVRLVHMQFPTQVISVKETDPAVLRPGEEARQVSELKVTVKAVDQLRIEVKACSGDGFGPPSIYEGRNIQRKALLTRALNCSGASHTGDREEIAEQINAFLDEHIGAAKEQVATA